MSTRDRRATRLLDPRWHWLQGAVQRLYAELDDQRPIALTLVAAGPGEQGMYYTAWPNSPEITRLLVTDIAELERASARMPGLTDATPPTTVDGDTP